jgi:hypothetical protein
MSVGKSLFDEIVDCAGLAAFIGPATVRRALATSGIANAEEAAPADFLRALPELKARMAIYLTTQEAEQRSREIAELLSAR